ncbi:MAG TPA: pentapeptide repeat-containing protein [Nostocaceae cyanobacterium]|nr:pentapeptide repeat-containing protein [Nostocaceae cyanobacterium]
MNTDERVIQLLAKYERGKRNFIGVDLSKANLTGKNLSGANLSEANLSEANLSGADLSGADLSRVDLSEAVLSYANLSRADLSRAVLSRAVLREAVLSRAVLSYANLSEAVLSGAVLSEADLSRAVLREADLSRAVLSEAELRGVDLSGAELRGVDLSGADLRGVDLSGANLSEAKIANCKNLKTANLYNTNFAGTGKNGGNNKLLGEGNEIPQNLLDTENFQGISNLIEVIYYIIIQENLILNLTYESLSQLIHIAFLASMKKEESRYPEFQIYVPIIEVISFWKIYFFKLTVESGYYSLTKYASSELGYFPVINNSTDYQEKLNQSMVFRFDQPMNVDSNNISLLARIGIGIPQKFGAFLVEGKETPQVTGIVQINNHDELFGELLDSRENLIGLFLSIENPGRINVLFNLPNGAKKQLAFTGRILKINANAVQNPLVNICFFEIAANIIECESLKKIFELTKIIQRVWHRVLKSVVNRNRGSQFVILLEDYDQMEINEYLNIGQMYARSESNQSNQSNENFGFYIKNFFEKYYEYKILKRSRTTLYNETELLEIYHKLINYIDLVANLSTVDGNIVFDRNLNLIGFGGEVQIPDDGQTFRNCYKYEVQTSFNAPLINTNVPCDLDQLSGRQKLKELVFDPYLEKDNGNPKSWEWQQYGTRHRSAARLCSKLDAFVFVVSQTGDVREFMSFPDNSVAVLGPLSPL